MTPGITAYEYALRRARLAAKLPPRSSALVAASSVKYRSGAVFYPFHQDADFFYLTGSPWAFVFLFLAPFAFDLTCRRIQRAGRCRYHWYVALWRAGTVSRCADARGRENWHRRRTCLPPLRSTKGSGHGALGRSAIRCASCAGCLQRRRGGWNAFGGPLEGELCPT